MLFSRSCEIGPKDLCRCTLKGAQIEQVPLKYLGIWTDDELSFKTHIEKQTKKLRIKIYFLYRNKSCHTFETRRKIVQASLLPVLDYGDIIYMHAAASVLKPLDSIYHSALRFIIGENVCTRHCLLYTSVGWESDYQKGPTLPAICL